MDADAGGLVEVAEVHATADEALSSLLAVPGAIGNFVRCYPGRSVGDSHEWLDTWFLAETERHFRNAVTAADSIQTTLPEYSGRAHDSLAPRVRIKDVQPHYFRGFRNVPLPIDLMAGLVVIDGRNSSGKTSLAEAIEWLFAGKLSRRESQELGNPRELENCVGNEFRNSDDRTWVSATFAIESTGREFSLRRSLTRDYGSAGTSTCASVLYLDDCELSSSQERATLEDLFGSVPPLLMQHTLRQFVQSDPRHRREYFERLLRLDELTDLISNAVVGDSRLSEFASPSKDQGQRSWSNLGVAVQTPAAKAAHSQLSRVVATDNLSAVRDGLVTIARTPRRVIL